VLVAGSRIALRASGMTGHYPMPANCLRLLLLRRFTSR
jgi:hypothetical protein